VKLDLSGNHFYFALLGELYAGIDDVQARHSFRKALSLARTLSDQQAIQKRIEGLE
jgi:hypothetical protein